MPDLLSRLLVHGSTVRIGRVQREPVVASITIPLVGLGISGFGLLAAILSAILAFEPLTARRSFKPFWPGSKLKPCGREVNSELVTVVLRLLLACSGSIASTASARSVCWPVVLKLTLLNVTSIAALPARFLTVSVATRLLFR